MARPPDRPLDRAITALLHEAVEHSRAMRQVLNQVGQLASARISAVSGEEPEKPSEPDLSEVLSPLTKREKEVLDHLARGRSNRQIGRALGISERTVKNHLRNIFTKLGVGDRTSAVVKALGHHD
ncbi:response regulator transcription factor [Saccharopolyspora flava]|uniref:Regulatory protein, luxR family n=1 Tax=Saccharopolyspora flava TaxID=95161 RepID=A0A1I6TL27_9PSEU|nr:response regulator transcription factor [Saccharopolyspora flava]SFS89840.1 regulatory protein, luxR family [Saccharopolyspora flava]